MVTSFKKYINLIRFSLAFKKNAHHENEESLSELIRFAEEERGILFKLIQHLYPEKISSKQNSTKSISKEKAISLIETELKIRFSDHFSDMSEAIFCASIGQVHKATLKTGPHSGKNVAIKIQFPEIKDSIKYQIKLLKLAVISSKMSPIAKWGFGANSHLIKIENRLNEELNYKHELNNLLTHQKFNSLSDNSNSSNFIFAYKEYCSSKTLTQSWIEGLSFNYINEKWTSVQKKQAADIIVESYFKQVFIDSFFQGDTNSSNFIFQESRSTVKVFWIDFGNWISLNPEVCESLYVLIYQTINGEDINYLGHFERLGFDLAKLQYLQNSLPLLVSILFEPFLINRPYDLDSWKMEERVDNLLGENKWWFRSSGNSQFLESMRSFFGIIKIIKSLNLNINWQSHFLKHSAHFNIEKINNVIPTYENQIPVLSKMASKLVIHILKNSLEQVKLELPATSLLDLENLIPDDVKNKLSDRALSLATIKMNYLKEGLIPGEVFALNSEDDGVLSNFRVYLI